MTKLVDNGFSDLWEFLSAYRLDESVEDQSFKAALKRCHKATFPLLVWRATIKDKPASGYFDEDFKRYFNETVSDASTSLFLFCNGLYKAAHLSLRAGLENAFRAFGLVSGQKVLSLTSVYELIELVGECDVVQKHKVSTSEYSKLRSQYSNLCKYVHTASDEHMSLLGALNELPNHSTEKIINYTSAITTSCASINTIITAFLISDFRKMHHQHRDAVLAGISPSMRKHVMSLNT